VGQGLTVARAIIVERHGGKLWFSSRVGQGTRFVVALPRSAPPHLGQG
jgi:signal transduction histidine kinase